MVALLLAAAPVIKTFDCDVESPKNVVRDGDKITAGAIRFNPARNYQWKFVFALEEKKDGRLFAKIDWPKDPVGTAGTFQALSTGERSFAVLTYNKGPCLFTETSCATVVNFIERPDGSAKVSLIPTAMGGDFGKDTRGPMHVFIDGTCQAREIVK